jgi:hypothetical protein
MKSAYAYFIKRPLPPACKPPGWKRGLKLVGWVKLAKPIADGFGGFNDFSAFNNYQKLPTPTPLSHDEAI